MRHASWRELVRDPAGERHIVQLYRDPGFLHRAVSAWVAPSLGGEGAALLVGTRENTHRILSELSALGLDPARLQAEGRLVVHDASALLPRLMHEGMPRADTFQAIADDVLRRVQRAARGGSVRAWGEMVDLLFHQGNAPAAQRLEALWNGIMETHRIHLLCSYRLDNLSPDAHASLGDVCAGHSQLIPEEDYDRLEAAVTRALVDLLGEHEAARARMTLAASRSIPIGMPHAEAILVAALDRDPPFARRLFAAVRAHMA